MVESISITKDKKYLVFGTRNNSVKILNYKDMTPYHTFTSHTHWVRHVLTIENNLIFSVCCDKTLRIFSIADKSELIKLQGSESFIYRACFSRDEQYLLTGATDNLMKLWKFGYPNRTKMLTGHSESVNSLEISSDDQWIVTGSTDKTVRIWSIQDGVEVAKLEGHTNNV